MPLVIRDSSAVPNERWHYLVNETNYDVFAPNYPALFSMVQAHCIANAVSVPSEQAVIDRLCATLSIPCFDSATKTPLINNFGLPAKPQPGCCGK